MRVLALTSYPVEAAATRFRIVQFIPLLDRQGITVTVRPFLDSGVFAFLYRRGYANLLRVGVGSARGAGRRLRDAVTGLRADVLFVQREAMLVGPPIWEWALTRLARRPMVLDLDDATYLPYASPVYGPLARLKWFSKTEKLIRWADVVTCGSRAILEDVRSLGGRGILMPSVVDTDRFCPASHSSEIPVVGWIGTQSTFSFLETILPVLERLARTHRFRLKIVGSGRDDVSVPGVAVENVAWSLEREVADFQSIDIGLYPITPSKWTAAKSGLKAVQYMAVGIPFVASPVGASAEIGEPGVTHLPATSPEEWSEALSRLLADPDLRARMGAAGRSHAVNHHSALRHVDVLAGALRDALRRRRGRSGESG